MLTDPVPAPAESCSTTSALKLAAAQGISGASWRIAAPTLEYARAPTALWFASVAVLDGGGYEVVRHDTAQNEHDVTTSTSIEDIAYDLTIWLTSRHFPGRPTRQSTNF
ncbi:hypothetical protein [Streptomyces sp. NPDC058228]|uniref:hypothetical protein n=1 Tax=Streptomyces sp. NPDC058228 TaxID=3346390 RepID=UPI0036E54E96